MAQQHLDRLTSVDAGFLHQEDGRPSHMHIGGLAIFEGPAPPFAEFLRHIDGRLNKVPRYRQKLAYPPLSSGRPLWVDDPRFDVAYHVRHTALPQPGDERQLLDLTARIMSERLDRSKPLWELWLVEGLEGGRVGLVSKTHHAVVDGISGAELLTVLLDLSPEASAPDEDEDPFEPHSEPSPLDLLATGVRDAVRMGMNVAGAAVAAATTPSALPERLTHTVEALTDVARALFNAAPASSINRPPGAHRRYAVVRSPLDDFKLIKNTFGGTVNDVVITVVAGAVGRFLRSRGDSTDSLELRAQVPVSVRGAEGKGVLDNRITIMLAPLPVDIDDPVERLQTVRAAMDGLKESKQALGASMIASIEAFAPPTILAQASRLAFSSRVYNLLITNVPGPQFPVYLLGRRLEEVFPVAFLASGHSLAVAVLSYCGQLDFGLLGDYDNLPDLDLVATGIADEIHELLDLAGRAAASPPRRASPERTARRAATRGTRTRSATAPSANGQSAKAATRTRGRARPSPSG